MDQSLSESDISMSPTQILERLKMLKNLQLLQRGKLQKQQLHYDSAELSSTITEVVSHFSNSTSYDTFRTLLQSSQEDNNNEDSKHVKKNVHKENIKDLIDGVTLLNLSQESEFCHSPVSTNSFKVDDIQKQESTAINKKHIALDEMPILTPKKSFESLIVQKLQSETVNNQLSEVKKITKNEFNNVESTVKRPYLRRGEGMTRFGIKKNELIIQNTRSLPWRQKKTKLKKDTKTHVKTVLNLPTNKNGHGHLTTNKGEKIAPIVNSLEDLCTESLDKESLSVNPLKPLKIQDHLKCTESTYKTDNIHMDQQEVSSTDVNSKEKRSFVNCNGKTWAAVLNKEQSDFLRKLKQSDYYKNFSSPCKSTTSDVSSDDYYSNLRHEKETAEQNLFELLEKKVTNESFNLENSFFYRFLQKNVINDSGESTPVVLKKCVSNNPNLIQLLPGITNKRYEDFHDDTDIGNNECTECSDTCSSVSSCCSCKTITHNNCSQSLDVQEEDTQKVSMQNLANDVSKKSKQKLDTCQEEKVTNNNTNIDMVEMNAKLIATSDLLKDRLRELEDEIETFRRENINMSKVREELDLERQKFYDEKREFEQKFNEEKILSEYYLSEEKDKLQKQKQIYERYVRDIRGRLTKKEKDEVSNLKKEIQDLKDEIKIKDAKSTSSIARFRNHIKILEKEKKTLEDEIEKLKKENRRIQHSNEVTRRLSNLKYLEQINKKLSYMATKDSQVDVVRDPDIKFKTFAIERQSRIKTNQPITKNSVRKRAKSVPNLNVTSRYAKYFSQKDFLSDMDHPNTFHKDLPSDHIIDFSETEALEYNDGHETTKRNTSESDEENHIEKIYNDKFVEKLSVKKDKDTAQAHFIDRQNIDKITDNFFIKNSRNNSGQCSAISPINRTLSPDGHNSSSASKSSNLSYQLSNGSDMYSHLLKDPEGLNENQHFGNQRDKSPCSFLSSHSAKSQKTSAMSNRDLYSDARLIPSPEPLSNRSSIGKTNLNPTEFTKTDGSRELRFPNGNIKLISADGKYSKFMYYNGDIKENFYHEGRIKYFYAESKTYHTTQADGLEVLEFPDGQIEKRYKDGSSEIRLPNGSVRYFDPKNKHIREEWRFPDGTALTVSANGEQCVKFANGQIEVHAKDHKRREYPDGTVKLVYNDGTSETRYASGRVRIKDKHGNLIMDSAPD